MPRNSEGRKLDKSKSRPEKTATTNTANITATDEHPSSPWPRPLKPQHELFADHYLSHFNGTEAAKAAGFSKKTAGSIASELLKRPDVRAEIKRRRYLDSQRIGELTRERLEREIACSALSNMQDYGALFAAEGSVQDKLALLTREQAAAVQEITVEEFRDGRTAARQVRRTKLKLVPKVTSQELYAKAKGWLTEKVEVDHQHQHLILAVMLKEIADEAEGKPIVDDARQFLDQKPEGEAA